MARSSRSLLQRETKYGVWTVKRLLRPTQYHFGTETRPYREFGKRWYIDALECQAADPVKLHEFGGRTWWWFKKQVYVERERLAAEDVKALALQLESAKSATLERARAEMRGEAAAASARAREPIPEAVRRTRGVTGPFSRAHAHARETGYPPPLACHQVMGPGRGGGRLGQRSGVTA